MRKSIQICNALLPTVIGLSIGCSSESPARNPVDGAGGAGGTATGQGGRSRAIGGATGTSQGGANLGNLGGVSGGGSYASGGSTAMGSAGGTLAESGSGGLGGASNGGSTSATSVGSGTSSTGGATVAGNSSTGGVAAAGSSAIGGVAGAGSSAIGGVAGAGSSATGGSATGGSATGGSATGGSATGGSATGGDSYQAQGVYGRIDVSKSSETSANVVANFFDRPMRMDAFAPYAPDLHELVADQGDCTLFKAATLACNPPCGSTEYCGSGSVCTPMAANTSAGTITVQGPNDSVSLVPGSSGYSLMTLPAANISPAANITVTVPGATTWSSTGLTATTPGVDTTGLGLPSTGAAFTLIDGQDKTLTWNASSGGTVQLLLNAGWHGAPPTATLICEAAASAGEIVIPQALIEAFPSVGGIGLLQHTSTVSLMRRVQASSDGRTFELVVTGYRAVLSLTH